MISKNKIKYIRSLEKKKFRNEYGCFVAEGNKLVADMLHSFDCEFILAKVSWMATQGDLAVKELVEAEENDLQKVSFQKTPQDVLAIFKLPDYRLEEVNPNEELVLALVVYRIPEIWVQLSGWLIGTAFHILYAVWIR